jgi:hypothetical protein
MRVAKGTQLQLYDTMADGLNENSDEPK